MQFDEKRYANKMICEFEEKHDLAKQLGGDTLYFEKLVKQWETYLKSL